ncbi:MAG: PH domain-containing protein [Micavibrio sp.]
MADLQPSRSPARPSASAQKILTSMLMEDENMLRVATISAGIYWKGLTILVIAILLFLKWPPLGILLLVVSGLMLLIAYLTKHFLLLAATDKRVFIRSGIINLDVIQMRYSKIESVELAWTLMGQFLGYSSVVITGTGNRVTIIPFVADGIQFREVMTKILLEKDDRLEGVATPA